MGQVAPTAKQQKFAEVLALTGNASEAYRATRDCSHLTNNQIAARACDYAKTPRVRAIVDEIRGGAMDELKMEMKDVMRHLIEIATADSNELSQHRRLCCRHCHGAGHAYQWDDEQDYALAVARAIHAGGDDAVLPTCEGGFGFNHTLDPHPECPKCRGEGVGDVFIPDTRKLSGAARRAYAGVKQTRNGIEVLQRDPNWALGMIAKIAGGITDRVEHTGKNGGPIVTVAIDTADPLEAARVYQEIMGK